jgi:hypothetical protein
MPKVYSPGDKKEASVLPGSRGVGNVPKGGKGKPKVPSGYSSRSMKYQGMSDSRPQSRDRNQSAK